jgi:hypothetical protein
LVSLITLLKLERIVEVGDYDLPSAARFAAFSSTILAWHLYTNEVFS